MGSKINGKIHGFKRGAPCEDYCSAIIFIALQKDCVKALSAACLDTVLFLVHEGKVAVVDAHHYSDASHRRPHGRAAVRQEQKRNSCYGHYSHDHSDIDHKVKEKQANTSVKQAEQDRRRRQIYGSERKTSQYFRKADRARLTQAANLRKRRNIRKSRQKAQTYFCTSPLKFTIFIVSFARKMI